MAINDGPGLPDDGRDHQTDPAPVRTRPEIDAAPDPEQYFLLHDAAENDSPEAVTELAQRIADVDFLDNDDEEYPGRTALWTAVFANRPDNARVLVAAGADPWRPMMNGWSPGRLSLAGPTPALFSIPPGVSGLSPSETVAVTEARRLIGALRDLDYFGLGMACVAGITAAEAARRLEAVPADDGDVAAINEDLGGHLDDSQTVVGVTDVPGGCIVSQPWGYLPNTPGVAKRLSAGTVCYGMYDNPKGGHHGTVFRDGVLEEGDTHPGGGGVYQDDPAEEILATYLYHHHAVAYCCARMGLRLTDAKAITGPPDIWLRLPERDWRN
ncbi:ankyrin repeat domain-containing protein [Nonomuraea sp. SBT364]|uniref:ankyrin repeat domain-containing protein n=1 Tax=Nonomuraea sp. SBT364 TaxID=1580530 RepID=UPI00066C3758|nr:ankyrin repeat domain-containing protein [Nonomuraea sp. SBT364]